MPIRIKAGIFSISVHAFILIALLTDIPGCKAVDGGGYSIKGEATTPKGNYDFSNGKIYLANQ